MTSFVNVQYPSEHLGVVRAENALEALKQAAAGFDGARGMAALLLAAMVSALLVFEQQVIDSWAERHQWAAWLALWLLAFAPLALLAPPPPRPPRRAGVAGRGPRRGRPPPPRRRRRTHLASRAAGPAHHGRDRARAGPLRRGAHAQPARLKIQGGAFGNAAGPAAARSRSCRARYLAANARTSAYDT